MKTAEFTVWTGNGRGLFDLTDMCERFVADQADGLLTIFVPHATVGIVIVELGAGSDVDLMAALDRLLPRDGRYVHRHGAAGHGADHLVSMVAAPSVTIPVLGGKLTLGTWQSVALLDPNSDNATRKVRLAFLAG